MSEPAFLELDGLTRSFDDEPAVQGLTLDVREHEILTLLGPSGCGKTTTLRMVAGFETPDRGRILLEGRDVTSVAPRRRGFGMVFQHYALFPHLDVAGNVAFGLESAGHPKSEIRERVTRALELVRMPGTENRSVASLSGGQQQRIALARALAPAPRVLLLDEPLSNLDATLRERTRRELRSLIKETGITTLYVTHDQEEAFDLSDRIAVLRLGRLEQLGVAETLYHRPATEFVASFLGRVGSVEATVESLAGGVADCRLPGGAIWKTFAPGAAPPGPGSLTRVLARPEALRFTEPGDPEAIPGRVSERRFAGSYYAYTVDVETGTLEIHGAAEAARVDDRVGIRPSSPPSGLHAVPSRARRG